MTKLATTRAGEDQGAWTAALEEAASDGIGTWAARGTTWRLAGLLG